MWTIRYSSKFKKDLKKYRHQADKIGLLEDIVRQLRDNGTVGQQYKPHMLSGQYVGCMECHIQNDFLLIWIDESGHTISLVRLGTHSELFK